MKKSFYALLATSVIASTLFLPVSHATENTPALISPASTIPTSSTEPSVQAQAQTIQWNVEQLEAKKLTEMNLEHYKKFLGTPGNHLVIYGLAMKEQLPLLQKLYTPTEGRFRLDLTSMTSKDQGGNSNKNIIVLPAFLSLANVNGTVQTTYGTKIITARTVTAENLTRKLQNENNVLRKELDDQIEKEISWYLTKYEERRQLAYDKPAFDRVGVVKSFHLESGSIAPIIGTVEGYWLINKESSPALESKTQYTIHSDFTFSSRIYNSSVYQIDSYKTGIQLKDAADELVSASPLATSLLLDGNKGMKSFEWPATGFSALLDASEKKGQLGSYTLTVKQKNEFKSLPNQFPLLFSSVFSSSKPTVSFETQHWFHTTPKDNEEHYTSSNDTITNE
ncbi:hypothetical protein [Brevibacillus sp. SYSU BS000544]|uniref:hypothetical protein n=1 Tax=Brevibacillus sp. SYSU BS000544 TaxID=3416443 RepID=UPI003CE55C53